MSKRAANNKQKAISSHLDKPIQFRPIQLIFNTHRGPLAKGAASVAVDMHKAEEDEADDVTAADRLPAATAAEPGAVKPTADERMAANDTIESFIVSELWKLPLQWRKAMRLFCTSSCRNFLRELKKILAGRRHLSSTPPPRVDDCHLAVLSSVITNDTI